MGFQSGFKAAIVVTAEYSNVSLAATTHHQCQCHQTTNLVGSNVIHQMQCSYSAVSRGRGLYVISQDGDSNRSKVFTTWFNKRSNALPDYVKCVAN